MSSMRLIVGLGNPGANYEWTPHNLGFLALDAIAERAGIRTGRPESQAIIGFGKLAGHDVLLAKPQTYMNDSGRAVRRLLERYECDLTKMIVLSDEVALPWGMLRIRAGGSAGGHNGLRSVIAETGSDEFLRMRMGVRPAHPVGDLASYVLCTMSREKREIAGEMAAEAAEAVEFLLAEGLAHTKSRYNRRVPAEPEAPEE
jgi:PTH1 family peptidyl-tRNA hydrolase